MQVLCPHCNQILDPQVHHSEMVVDCPYCQRQVRLPVIAEVVQGSPPRRNPQLHLPGWLQFNPSVRTTSTITLVAAAIAAIVILAILRDALGPGPNAKRMMERQRVENPDLPLLPANKPYRVVEIKEQPLANQRLIQVLVPNGTQEVQIRAWHASVLSDYRKANTRLFVNYYWDAPYVDPVYGHQIGTVVAIDEGRGSGLLWWGP